MAKPPEVNEEVKTANDFEAYPIEWLWENRIPKGMLTGIFGRPDQGKSLFTMFLASEVTRQKGGAVILSNTEDSPNHVLRPRLEAVGAVLKRVHFFSPTLPRDIPRLRKLIEKTGAKVVILDPVSAHLEPSLFNDQEIRKALTPMTALASETDCAIVMVGHITKKVGDHPIASVGGSGGGLAGACRTIFAFGLNPDNSDERVLVPIKFNIAEKPKGVSFEIDEVSYDIKGTDKSISTGRLIMLDDAVETTAMKVLRASSDNSISAEKRAGAAEWLTEYLADGAKKVSDLKLALNLEGISWRTLRRAADDIGIIKTRIGGGAGSYITWDLPPGHPLRGS